MAELMMPQPVTNYLAGQEMARTTRNDQQLHGQKMQMNEFALQQQRQQMQDALFEDVAIGAAYADTPEKWNQVIDTFKQRGLAEAENYRDKFHMREAFVKLGSPETRNAALQYFEKMDLQYYPQ